MLVAGSGLIIRLRKDIVGSTPTRPTIRCSSKIPGVPSKPPQPLLYRHFKAFAPPGSSCVDGPPSMSFTMLTVNANEHPLMKRFHKPGDEKRSVVIVPPTSYEDWLNARSTDEARSFLNLYPAEEMAAQAAPLPPRKPVTIE